MALTVTAPYILNKEFIYKLVEEGTPTILEVVHANGDGTGYANRETFTLDSSDYDDDGDGDDETTPMLGKTFLITGLRFQMNTTAKFGGLIIDGRLILNSSYLANAAGEDVLIDGMDQAFGNLEDDLNAPSMKEALGVYAIPARATIEVYKDTDGSDMDCFFIGFLVDRKY